MELVPYPIVPKNVKHLQVFNDYHHIFYFWITSRVFDIARSLLRQIMVEIKKNKLRKIKYLI